MGQAIPVFLISLARAAERRKAATRHLRHIGAEFELIEGVDGSALSKEELVRVVAPGVELPLGHIGCYMSHIRTYEQFLKTGKPHGLVVEDDARPDPRFVRVLQRGIENADWDYCYLNCDWMNSDGQVFYDAGSPFIINETFRAYRLSGGPWGCYSYMITREAARRRLEHAFPIAHEIDVYSKYPYPVRFRAIVGPKGSWLNEQHYQSYVTGWSKPMEQLPFARLRRSKLFVAARDALRFHGVRGWMKARQLVRQGKLPPGAWRALPTEHVLFGYGAASPAADAAAGP
ncbi:MAG: glycosyltransferase family 25 protein [Gemmatimonadales bacterium]|nr:glycosyltransferase family 25 protein [Gemmatimonadales bacterium]